MSILKNRTIHNAAWLIGGKVIQSLLGLVISMFMARYLGPSNYGIINYAASIATFLIPVAQLGFTGILVQECVTKPENEGEIFGTALLSSVVSSILCIIGMIAFAILANRGEAEVILVCTIYSLMLLVKGLELVEYWFQAKLLSKYTAIATLCAYLIVSAYRIVLLVTQKSVAWFAFSYCLESGLITLSMLALYGKKKAGHLRFSMARLREMLRKSKFYILSGLMISVFAQTDRIMLKLMIDETATGYYSAAVTIAGLSSFVFAAIIDSARPSIFKSKLEGQAPFEQNMKRLYAVVIDLALLQSVGITLLAKWIVWILYGGAYSPSVQALRIVVWYTTFSYIGSVRNIWLLAEEKQHLIWKIDLSGAVANVLLNCLLIPLWGINGAALASLCTQMFANVVMGWILREARANNKLMFASLHPKVLAGLLHTIKK